MIVRVERVVPFPRDAVYAWWTDFRPDDHPGGPSPAKSMREVLRQEGREIWLRDRARRPAPITVEEHVILDPPEGYTVEARYPGAAVRYRYRFEPDRGATRVVLEADVRGRRLGRLVLPVLERWARRYAERDTDFHLAMMARDLRNSAPGRGPPR